MPWLIHQKRSPAVWSLACLAVRSAGRRGRPAAAGPSPYPADAVTGSGSASGRALALDDRGGGVGHGRPEIGRRVGVDGQRMERDRRAERERRRHRPARPGATAGPDHQGQEQRDQPERRHLAPDRDPGLDAGQRLGGLPVEPEGERPRDLGVARRSREPEDGDRRRGSPRRAPPRPSTWRRSAARGRGRHRARPPRAGGARPGGSARPGDERPRRGAASRAASARRRSRRARARCPPAATSRTPR